MGCGGVERRSPGLAAAALAVCSEEGLGEKEREGERERRVGGRGQCSSG